MAKKKSTRKAAKKKAAKRKSTRSRKPKVDSADGVRVGEEPVPGMRLRCICRGHQGTIGRIAWSPCGRFIASPSEDKTIRIWDANDGKCLAVLKGHQNAVQCVVWSPDGREIVTGSEDKSVRTWKVKHVSKNARERIFVENKPVRAWEHQAAVETVSWSPDRRMIAAGSYNGGAVRIWNRNEDTPIKTIGDHPCATYAGWSSSGKLFATASIGEYAIRAWRLDDSEPKWTSALGTGTIAADIAWGPSDNVLAVACQDGRIRILNGHNGRLIQEIEGHTSTVRGICYSADFRLLVSQSDDQTVRVWNADSYDEIESMRFKSSGFFLSSLAFHPQSPRLAMPDKDDNVLVWELDYEARIRAGAPTRAVRYTSAKIVLVGESNVGKSCLAMRLAEDRYPDDHEHGTTHGMRFWPMEAEELHPRPSPPKGSGGMWFCGTLAGRMSINSCIRCFCTIRRWRSC